jgi:hypothetical protein
VRNGASFRWLVGLLLAIPAAMWATSAIAPALQLLTGTPRHFLLPILAVAAIAAVLRRDLIVLFAVVVLVNVPYLSRTVWDIRDTTATYEMFHAIYAEFYHSGRLLLWLPYGTFGQPTEYVTGFYCSGVDFAVLLIGKLLGIRDTWILFAGARLGEQLVFLLGAFALSHALFTRRSTVYLVCLASAGGIAWYWHFFFSLRLIYVFPLALLFLMRFFERRRPEFLWLCGLACVFAGQSASYLMCLWLFALSIVGLVLFAAQPGAWRAVLSRSWRNVVPMTLFVAAAAAYLYVSATAVQGFDFTKDNRDATSGAVQLEDYLHHGGNPALTQLVSDLLAGNTDINQWDNNFYAGLLPLFFFAWGLATERTARFWAIAAACIALFWLSFGGAFSTLVYYFPTMSYFRWLAWLVPLPRVLLILAAGFGFERFWSSPPRPRLTAGLFLLLLFAVDASAAPYRKVFPLVALYGVAAAAALAPGSWTRLRGHASPAASRAFAWTPAALVVALAVDVLGYQHAVHGRLPGPTGDIASRLRQVFSVARLEYQERRTPQPSTPRAIEATSLVPVSYPLPSHNFLQWDPCALGGSEPAYVLMVPSGIRRLFSVKAQDDDDAFQRVIGCEGPKLRLVAKAVYAADDDHAAALIASTHDLDRLAVLQLPRGTALPVTGPQTGPLGNAGVTAFSANRVEVEAEVVDPRGAWLVYADGYHRGWRAAVNGRPATIAKAYLAFKAVWLPPGKSTVRLAFWDGLTSALMYLLAAWSVLVVVLLALWFVKLALGPPVTIEAKAPPLDGVAPALQL